MKLSTRLEQYLAGLLVTQGEGIGQPFRVMPWQRKFLRGFDRPGDLGLSVGRGNGKTALLAGVAAAAVDPAGPLSQPRGEVVIVASSFGQARIDFEHVKAFLQPKLDRDPKAWRIWDTAQTASIEHRDTGARVSCIGSDPRRAHGRAPVLVLADEPAQWESTKSDAMVAALRTALGKLPGARFAALGTRPSETAHWFAAFLDECGLVYAAPDGASPFTLATIRRANPSAAFMPTLLQAIRQDAARARIDPSALARYEALRLNRGVADTVEALLLSAAAWAAVEADDVDRRGPYILGLDLGGSAAQSACAAYWTDTGGLEAFAAFPEVPSLAERGIADGVGRLYQDCHRRGELLVAGRRIADVTALLAHALEQWGRPVCIVADRFREAELRQTLEAMGFPLTGLSPRGQGFRDGADDVRRFRAAVLDGRVVAQRSLLLRAAIGGARVVSDPSGASKLAKASEGRRRGSRDDAAAACILAVAEGSRRAGHDSPGVAYAIAG